MLACILHMWHLHRLVPVLRLIKKRCGCQNEFLLYCWDPSCFWRRQHMHTPKYPSPVFPFSLCHIWQYFNKYNSSAFIREQKYHTVHWNLTFWATNLLNALDNKWAQNGNKIQPKALLTETSNNKDDKLFVLFVSFVILAHDFKIHILPEVFSMWSLLKK